MTGKVIDLKIFGRTTKSWNRTARHGVTTVWGK